MATFDTQQNINNLIYDNQAFSYFLISLCTMAVLVLLIYIVCDVREIYQKSKSLGKLKKQSVYKYKIQKMQQQSMLDFVNLKRFARVICLIFCICTAYYMLMSNTESNKMAGFDPYEILNVSMDATNSQIKKSYRKLALQFHPDTTRDYGMTKNKFILISKAYKCLTSSESRENCLKYGNPDGEIAHKIGIGLPSSILNREYLIYIISILLPLILIIIPLLIFSGLNQRDTVINLSIANKINQILMTPVINQTDFSIICAYTASARDMREIANQQTREQYEDLRSLLRKSSSLPSDMTNKIGERQLAFINWIFRYLNHRQQFFNQKVTEKITKICKEVLENSFKLALRVKRIHKKQNGLSRSWYGILPSRRLLTYCWKMQSCRLSDNEDCLICDKHKNQELNLHQIIWNSSRRQQQMKQLIQENESKMKDQLQYLPKLKLSSKVTIEGKQVKQVTKGDIAMVQVTVQNVNKLGGFVVCSQNLSLFREQFVIVAYSNANLYAYHFFHFTDQQRVITYEFELKDVQIKEGLFKLNVEIWSLNYTNFIAYHDTTIEIFKKTKKRPVQIHEQDKNLEKMPKNFYEKLIQLKKASESDLQLSDSKDSDEQNESKLIEKKVRSKLYRKVKLKKYKVKKRFSKYGAISQQVAAH